MSKPKSQLNKTRLASELADLLNLPRGAHGQCPLARQVVDTILDTMATALHRGEEVKIRDFGRFSVRSAGRRVYKPLIARGVYSPVWVEFPAKKRVYFTPSKGILK